jgi:predicted phage tail protein
MRNVYLYGHLKKQFGAKFRLNVDTPGQAIRLLNANFPGFSASLRKGWYRLIIGDRAKGGQPLDLAQVEMRLGRDDFHLVPVAAGAKSGGGAMKAVLGVALVGAAIFFSGGTLAAPLAGLGGALPGLGGAVTWGNLAGLGAIMTIAGVSQMIAPQAKSDTGTRKEDSFALAGPQNLDAQGYPVPLVIGEVIAGGIPVSTDYDVEDLAMGVA